MRIWMAFLWVMAFTFLRNLYLCLFGPFAFLIGVFRKKLKALPGLPCFRQGRSGDAGDFYDLRRLYGFFLH